MKVGIVGYGYWGPNLARNFARLLGTENLVICDADPAGRARASRDYPGISTAGQISDLLTDPEVLAVVVATPAASHRTLAEAAIRAGKHVLVEKPMATSSADGVTLMALAQERGLVLMSDHTFVFNPAVLATKELISQGHLGRVDAILSNRLNLGLHRPDVDVLWDLYIHDLSIFQFWLGGPPESVMATGTDTLGTGKKDIAFVAARYPGGCIAQVNVSWLAPRKARDMTVIGSRGMAVYDDTAPEKLLYYETRADLDGGKVAYTAGGAQPVPVPGTEALELMASHFLDCIWLGQRPVTGPAFSLDILRSLEAVGRALEAPATAVNVGGTAP